MSTGDAAISIRGLGKCYEVHHGPRHTTFRDVVMDRLHAYAYFLEGLVPVLARRECAAAMASGIERVARLLREIAPVFARSDVYAT